MRHLIVILGDQLDRQSLVLEGFDPEQDTLWMAEVMEESTHVWSHKARIALFLSAMRHFAEDMVEQSFPMEYLALESHANPDLASALRASLEAHRPQAVRMVRAGDVRVHSMLQKVCEEADIPLNLVEDQHFIATLD